VSDEEGEQNWLRLRGNCGRFFGSLFDNQRDAPGDGFEYFISEEVAILRFGPVSRGGAELLESQDGGNIGGSGEAKVQVGSDQWLVASTFFHLLEDFGVGAADVVGFEIFGGGDFSGPDFAPA
jgi:hypothetical protein